MPSPRRALANDADTPDFGTASSSPRRAALPTVVAPSFTKQRRPSGAWRRSLAPLAVMAAFSTIVGLGVATPSTVNAEAPESKQASLADATALDRSWAESRSVIRPTIEPTATPTTAPTAQPSATPPPASPTAQATPEAAALGKVVGTKYSTSSGVNVRATASTSGDVLGTLARAAAVKVTDVTSGDWQQISYNDKAAWVSTKLLSNSKPAASTSGTTSSSDVAIPASGDYSTAACKYGSGIEAGITANTKRVFRAFCAVFPTITSYGGYRAAESWSYHTRGAAIDAMVSDRTLGWQMAKWAAANASALNIDQVIYAQRIWTKQNPTWRAMSDRGSVTANHYDHVHISVG